MFHQWMTCVHLVGNVYRPCYRNYCRLHSLHLHDLPTQIQARFWFFSVSSVLDPKAQSGSSWTQYQYDSGDSGELYHRDWNAYRVRSFLVMLTLLNRIMSRICYFLCLAFVGRVFCSWYCTFLVLHLIEERSTSQCLATSSIWVSTLSYVNASILCPDLL